ncbi:MAG: cytochrome C5 [Marinobacter sp. T13-3]|nr:MAG: cytochrome C5 [Marinobacter sp. T13-3]
MKRVLAVVLLGFGLAAGGTALASVEDEIRNRIEPVGDVCLQGEDCGSAAPAPAAASSGPRSGQAVFDAACTACHSSGVAGAPVVGDAGAWGPRIDKGMDTLKNHALNGFNAMPARGACSDCSDEEIFNAIEYMVEQAQ